MMLPSPPGPSHSAVGPHWGERLPREKVKYMFLIDVYDMMYLIMAMMMVNFVFIIICV